MDDIKLLKTKQAEFKNVLENIQARNNEFVDIMEKCSTKCENLLKLEETVSKLDEKVSTLETHNQELKEENALLSERVNNLEAYAYRNNIEIKNVPVARNENLFLIFNAICKLFKFKSTDMDVKYIHRTFTRSDDKPLIIEFFSKFVRDNFLLCVRNSKLKIFPSTLGFNGNSDDENILNSLITNTTNTENYNSIKSNTAQTNTSVSNENDVSKTFKHISFYEQLPPWKKRLLYEASTTLKPLNFKYVWSKHNKIFCKFDDKASTVTINSHADVLDIVQQCTNTTFKLKSAIVNLIFFQFNFFFSE